MNDAVIKQTRKLYDWEVEEFRPLFGNTLQYALVRIHTGTPWPDTIDRLGRKLKRMPPPSAKSHNAMTLGNHCYFPIQLPEILVPLNHPDSYMLDWLVHELTHCWQFQNTGWKYLVRALLAQFRDKENAYEYGGAEGLIKSRQKGINFKQFNPEQQGNIVQAYYLRKRKGQDVAPWEPYIEDLNRAS